jgi:hypothetical protein
MDDDLRRIVEQFDFTYSLKMMQEILGMSMIALSRVNAMWAIFPRVAASALKMDEDDCRTTIESAFNDELTHRITDLIARFGTLGDDPPGR